MSDTEARLDALERRILELEAERHFLTAPVVILDGEGRPILEVKSDRAGNVLTLYGTDGYPAAQIASSCRGGAVQLSNEHHEPAVSLHSAEAGGALVAHSPDGMPVAMVRAAEHGGSLAAGTAAGVTVATLSSGPDGAGRVDLYDEGGQPLFEASNLLGDGAVFLWPAEGHPEAWVAQRVRPEEPTEELQEPTPDGPDPEDALAARAEAVAVRVAHSRTLAYGDGHPILN